jgi:hypothetical protein
MSWMIDRKSECGFCGQYENPTNDEESRMDNPENPEHFIVVRARDEVDIIHDTCHDNW